MESQSATSRPGVGLEAPRILLIDDEKNVVDSLGELLRDDGCDVTTSTDPYDACERFSSGSYDFVITDLKMPGMDGIDVLRRVKEVDKSACVILFTGHATVQSAIEALNLGAYEYILKPVRIERLRESLRRAREHKHGDESNTHTLKQLEESNRRLSRYVSELNALYESSRQLSSTREISDLLDSILSLAARVTDAEVGSVMLIDESAGRLRVAAAEGLDPKLINDISLPIGESIAGFVAQEGEPLLIKNVEEDQRFKRRSKERYGNASLICVPLQIGSRTLGVINLSRKSDGSVFTDEDMRLLAMFGAQAAVAIDDARQFEDKSRQLTEFRAIHELATRMTHISSQDEMLELVFHTLKKLLPLEYCIWLTHDPTGRTLRADGVVGREFTHTESGKIIIDNAKLEEPVARGVDLFRIDDTNRKSFDDYIGSALRDIGFGGLRDGAFLAAPVRREGEVKYVVCIGTTYIESYSEHERSLAEIVVSQAAVLYEKEKSLLSASRLVTMGNMISEISHDLRKPLTAIKGSAGLLRKRVAGDEELEEMALLIEDESHRLNELVSELVDFSKPDKYEAVKTDLRRLVIRALELVAGDLERHSINTSVSFDETNWELIVNKNQIFEGILNLLMNAVDAMPSGGELSVSGGLRRPDFKNADYLALSIKDTGVGISKADQAKLFNRYFTTKESGTGLGLAVVERVISAHNGTVTVDSTVGQGATFTLYFPLDTLAEGRPLS